MKKGLHILTLSALAVAIVLWPDMAAACPTCKDSLHENGAALGYAISIIFMMSMPMLIMAFWIVMIWRLRRGLETNSGNDSILCQDESLKSW